MSAHFYEVCFVNEIVAGTHPSNNSKSLRLVAKLISYNPITCVGRFSDPECKILQTIAVNLKFIEDVSFIKDSVYQVTGEIEEVGNEKVLHSYTIRNIDGIDFQMFKEAIYLRRRLKLLGPFLKQKMPKFKQATLSSLKGVVVVEDFLRHKNILDNPDESEETVLSALVYLKNKKPCREIINSTKIGSTLKLLGNHSNEDIANKAKDLCEYWEVSSAKSQPTVEVRYDNLTMHIRKTSLNLFLKELGGEEKDENLADILEKEIFHCCKRLISKNYRRTVRKVIFVLRHDKNENIALKAGAISPTKFVKKYLRRN